MIQKIKSMLNDDRGVSPVIGVILMVAITVILAAVIGSFVLSLGGDLEQAPQAQLSADTNAAGDLEISHNGGTAIPVSDIDIVVAGSTSDFSTGSVSGEFSVGDVSTFTSETPSAGTQIRIVHTPSDSIILDTTL